MSFDIALSGIQAINESLNSTSQNIANAGTYGYKAERANFSSLVSGNAQVGVTIGSTTQYISKPGGILNTGRALDATINGSGFFIAKDANSGQTEYTRVGIFDTSNDGYLIDAAGRRIQGYPVNTATGTQGALGDVPIPTGAIPAVVSTKMNYVGNMSADWTAPLGEWNTPAITPSTPPDPSTFNMSKATVVYDSLGGKHTLTQYFQRDATNVDEVNINYVLDGNLVGGTATKMKFDTASGTLQGIGGVAGATTSTIDLSTISVANGGKLGAVAIDYTGTTGFAGEATTSTNSADGYASGTFTSLALGNDGSLIATYTNGQKQTVGRLALATFANEGALQTVSGTSWVESVQSGSALVNAPGVGMGGTISSSSLEQSNVDITSELVGLMTSQRNYQANSKVIQTESTMLQSLMQAI
jgi:flagellar hook protein FlgE